jgi:hypothetical protein
MDVVLIVLAIIVLGTGLLAYDELAHEGKFLDGILSNLRRSNRN